MGNRKFHTFNEASAYARDLAQQTLSTVKLVREDAFWTVFTGNILDVHEVPIQHENISWHEQRKHRQEQSRIDREIEKKRAQERNKRQSYVDSKQKQYESMSSEELNSIWSKREELDLLDDEIALIRGILRAKLGIKPAYGHSAHACPTCGMVGDSCTCNRSWY